MRSRLNWAGHVERMDRERLKKRADDLGVEGGRRRRPSLIWADCVQRSGSGSGRRKRARDRGGWRMRARNRWSGDGWWKRQ